MRKRKLKAPVDSAEAPPVEHCRRVSTEQLISKFKSLCRSQPETSSGYLVASITDALSQYSLPEVPPEEIYDVLGDVLSVCKSPQHSTVEMAAEEGTSTPVTRKRNLRSRRNNSSSPSKKLQPKSTVMKQCSSSKTGSKHPDNTSTISEAGPQDTPVKYKVGAFPPVRVPVVVLKRVTNEEIESLCQCQPSPQSPASKVSLHSVGSESPSPVGKKISNLILHATNSARSRRTCEQLAADPTHVQREELPDSDETCFDDSAPASKTVQDSGNAGSSRVSKGTCNQAPRAAEPAKHQHTHNKHAAGSGSPVPSDQHHEGEPEISPLSALLAPPALLAPSGRSKGSTCEDSAARCPKQRHLQSSPVSRASRQAQGDANRSPGKKQASQATREKCSGDANRKLDGHLETDVWELSDDDIVGSPSLLTSPSRRLNSVSSKACSPMHGHKQRTLVVSDEFVEVLDTSSESEPKPEDVMRTSASGRDHVQRQSAQAPQDFEARPTTSRSDAQGSGEATWTYLSPTRTKPAPAKKSRVRFTPLQEEALVYGVMKYGHGSWKYISDEGWFDGRRTAELSDKYRNLEKYGHLPEVKKRVKAMLANGVNPLKKLRAWNLSTDNPRRVCDHSEQPIVKPKHRQQGLRVNTSAKEKDPTNELGTFVDSEEECEADQTDISSLDGRATRKKTPPVPASPTRQAAASSRAADSSIAAPPTSSKSSTRVAHDSSSSNSSEERPMKTKGKSKRVPFTLLEEEALVSGYLKYGKGNWARILQEGGFVGRTSIQLSDKFRNLVLYRQLPAVTKSVNAKIARGEDPLLEMRKLVAAHWRR